MKHLGPWTAAFALLFVFSGCGGDNRPGKATTGTADTAQIGRVKAVLDDGGNRRTGTTYAETATILGTFDDSTPGFGQFSVDPANRKIAIYWKGEPPTRVKRLIGQGRDGSHTVLYKVPFSSHDYREAGNRVFAKMAEIQGSPFQGTTEANSDMTGLVLSTPKLLSEEQLAEISQVAGMPVVQVKGDPVKLLGAHLN